MPRSKKSTIQSNPLNSILSSIDKKKPKVENKKIGLAKKAIVSKDEKTSPDKKEVPIVASKNKLTKTVPLPRLAHDDSVKTDRTRRELTKKEIANIVIKKWAQLASLVVIAPLPFLATSTSSGFQITMIRDLCKIYNVPFHRELVKASVSSILSSGTGVFTVSYIARELLQGIPYLGTAFQMVAQPTMVYKITESLGGVFMRHFEKNGDLTDLDLQAAKKIIKTQESSSILSLNKKKQGSRFTKSPA
jgi:uncharacterized protein (DUF697 family)